MSQIVGHISQVIGPVVDVVFRRNRGRDDVAEYSRRTGNKKVATAKRLIVEVQQHIGENTVRTVAMDSTGRPAAQV